MTTRLRLTDAGRTAMADGTNRQLRNVQIVALAIGDGTGPGGAADDARTALRSQRARADMGGTTAQAGRIALRADFSPDATYSVTEMGVIGRIGAAGDAFLLAYWAVPNASMAIATTAPNLALVVAGVFDITHAAAETAVTVDGDVTFGGPGTLLALSDTPAAFSAGRYLRAAAGATSAEFDQAPPVVATEAALPAAATAQQHVYLVAAYSTTGLPAVALKSGNTWTVCQPTSAVLSVIRGGAPSNRDTLKKIADALATLPGAAPNASTTRRGIVELATTAEALSGTDPARAVTPAGLEAHSPPASTTARGLVELATTAEVLSGTDPARVVTPVGLEARVGTIGIPTGAMMDFGGAEAPDGWLLCNGQAVSREDYPALFTVIGDTYGAGDGSVTFNVPDLRRRVGVGAGGTGTAVLGAAVGDTGGDETHTLGTSELPGHTHGGGTLSAASAGAHSHGMRQNGDPPVGYLDDGPVFYDTFFSSRSVSTSPNGRVIDRMGLIASGGSHSHSISGATGATGGGTGHNNLQPSLVVSKIIKT